MSLVRAINITKYSRSKGRFDGTFKNFHGGISVFDYDCAIGKSKSICNHIDTYYTKTVGSPPIYFRFEKEWIDIIKKSKGSNESITLENIVSDSGDDCHVDIKNMSNGLGNAFEKEYINKNTLFICVKGEGTLLYDVLDDEMLSLAKDEYLKAITTDENN